MIYIARVTAIVDNGEYYRESKYRERPDCIYELNGRTYDVRSTARYHDKGCELTTDLGLSPDYGRATVLLSSDFRYFGRDGEDVAITDLVERNVHGMARGHRVHHTPELRDELLELQASVWKNYERMRVGEPSHEPPDSVAAAPSTKSRC